MPETPKQAAKRRAARRREIDFLRLLWHPIRLTQPGALPRVTAWTLTLGLYSTQWLYGAFTALVLLFFPPPAGAEPESFGALLQSMITASAFIFVGIAGLQLLAQRTDTPAAHSGIGFPDRFRSVFGTFAVYCMAVCVFEAQDWITSLLGSIPGVPERRSFPWSPIESPEIGMLTVFDTMLGGAIEEFLVLAVPMVALRAAGIRWRFVLPVLVILRFVFHVYYGPTAVLGYIVWALLLACLYAATGRIWPLFFAHMTGNGFAAMGYVGEQLDLPHPDTVAIIGTYTTCMIAFLGLAISLMLLVSLWTARRHYASRTACQHPTVPARR